MRALVVAREARRRVKVAVNFIFVKGEVLGRFPVEYIYHKSIL